MPDPQADPNFELVKRIAKYALIAGAAIAGLKFLIFWLTNSVAVLSDGLESLINVAAAGFMLYTIWYSNRPADRDHPYGHGKIEFMAVGLEGWLILVAGVVIAFEAVRRLFVGAELNLGVGLWLLGGVAVLDGALAGYVLHAGRKYDNAVLKADGKHLLADVASTVTVFVGLLLVRWTGRDWLDPILAVIVAGAILFVSWRLLWQSFHGLMDRADPSENQAIREILDDEVRQGTIRGYHKVRHRHTGPFRWIEMHLQVDGEMTIAQGHELASRVEGRIERHLGRANATAHLEPYDPVRHPPAGLCAEDLTDSPNTDTSPATQTPTTPTSSSESPPGADAPAPESPPPPPPPADRPELADQRDPDEDHDEPPPERSSP